MKTRHKICNFTLESFIEANKIVPVIFIPYLGIIAMLLSILIIKVEHKRNAISDEEYYKKTRTFVKGFLISCFLTLIFMVSLRIFIEFL